MWTHGRHVLHTGFEYWRYRVNSFYSGNSGSLGAILFSGAFTSENPVAPGAGGNGFGGADFYLGMPSAYGSGLTCCVWAHRSSTIAGYVQDDWRVTNNLTLNLGVRYETFTPWVEKDDHQVNFDLTTGEVLAPELFKSGSGNSSNHVQKEQPWPLQRRLRRQSIPASHRFRLDAGNAGWQDRGARRFHYFFLPGRHRYEPALAGQPALPES